MNADMDIMDISNYSFDDLKSFLKVDANLLISKEEVEKKADDMIDKLILMNTTSDAAEKKNMLKFIQQARDALIANLNNPFQNAVTVLKKPDYNEFSSPPYSKEPHFVQNTYAMNKKSPNQININYRTRLCVFNTLFCDEFLYETTPQVLKGDVTGAIDFTFTMTNPIKNVIGMSLSALQYPNVQPTFSIQKGNIFMYIVVDDGSNTQAVIQMNNGFFNSTTFPPVLEQNINMALYGQYFLPSANPVTGEKYTPNLNNPFAVVISPYTNRVTIMNTDAKAFRMIMDMPAWDNGYTVIDTTTQEFVTSVCSQKYPYQADLPEYYVKNKLKPNSLGFQMGFRNIVYLQPYADQVVDEAHTFPEGQIQHKDVMAYTGESQYDDTNGGYVYFCVNEFANNRVDDVTGVFPTYYFDNNILALVPITSAHFVNTLDTGADFIFKARNYTGPVDITKLVVSMYNASGIKISFNQVPFAFSLEFKVLYDNPPTIEKIEPRYWIYYEFI